VKNVDRTRGTRASQALRQHIGEFSAAVRLRYTRRNLQPDRLRLLVLRPSRICLRRDALYSQFSVSISVVTNLPVTGTVFRAPTLNTPRIVAATTIDIVRVERTMDRLQAASTRASETFRHRLHPLTTRELPPLLHVLARPAPSARNDSIWFRQEAGETRNHLVGQVTPVQSRPGVSVDVDRITEQVIRKIDRRVVAARERLGRI
jgi:hypothetical protein